MIISLIKHALLIGLVAYALIVIGVYAIPHLPLANGRTFRIMLRSQMTLDGEKEAAAKGEKDAHLLLLGSSVVERGINDIFLDSLFTEQDIPFYSTNSGAGGFFSKANLIMFRAMLEQGLRPARVVYGIFLEELNGRSGIHGNVTDEDTVAIKLKQKSFWNVMRYGPTALSPLLDGNGIHIYLFALNNAFRDVHDPNFFQRLSFGENLFERDSTYDLNQEFLQDLKEIYLLCKERKIPFAFFNTPVRPRVESLADLPYLHREEAYHAVEQFAIQENIPIWNFDQPGLFENREFVDTYHLSPDGARKMTKMLAEKIGTWHKGIIEQDITAASTDSVRNEIKDSLLRTIFHF
ncbi:MAG: hypothetical protein ACHQM6_03405 [Candidatus Kapaibacterium sp.]